MIYAVGCKVILKVQDVEEFDPTYKRAKAAGIVLADTEDKIRRQASVDKGVVIAMGPSCSEHYTKGLEIGDIVAFPKYGGKIVSELEDEQDKYCVINDEDVQCILRKHNG
jgi:co-chaperonin GroES (HSP10)